MDWILVILIILAMGMALFTFLQYTKTQKAKKQYMQPIPQQPQSNPHPEYNQQLQPAGQPNISQHIRQNTQNINKVAKKNYQETYQNLANEMQTKKIEAKNNVQSDIREQQKIYGMMERQKQAGGKIEFDRTVDEQNWERNNLWAINEAKVPTHQAQFTEPELDQQQYWSQNSNLVYILLGIAGFVLFMVMVL